MIEYTHGGWMPPQQPSASCLAMIQSVQRRSAAWRTLFGSRGPIACSALSSALNAADQGSFWSPFGGGPEALEYSSPSWNGSGRLGRCADTTASATIVCRAQQPQS